MKTFIQVTEIWVPSKDRTLLEFHDGLYGDHAGFRRASEQMCFGYDEGLPGRAWALRQPIILADLQNSYFRRAAAAQDAGLSCAIALPIFAGDYLLAVVVFFVSADDDHIGAIEIWRGNDAAPAAGMEFVDGYFGIAKKFEWTARNTKFMKGFGLPGMVWASGMPVLAENMLNSSTFLRAEDARRIGINKGLGIPCSDGTGRMFVMNLVSAMGLPIARRFEIWVPSSDSAGLVFLEGECDINKNFADDYAGVMLERYSGVLSHAWTTGIPAVSGDVAVQAAPAVRASAEKAGLKEMLAIPVMVDGKARALVAMYY